MSDLTFTTKSFSLDDESRAQLSKMAKIEKVSESYIVRRLINQAFAQLVSQPNPVVTIEQAQAAAEVVK